MSPPRVAATAVTALFFLGVVGAGLRAQRRRVTTGAAGLVGRHALVLERLGPDGVVRVQGERWNAVSETTVEVGREVEITRVQGLTVHVRPVGQEARP